MSTKPGSLSLQERKRLHGGELILKGYDNDEIADIVEVTPSAVKKWRRKLKATETSLASIENPVQASLRHSTKNKNNNSKQSFSAVPSPLAIPPNAGHRKSLPI